MNLRLLRVPVAVAAAAAALAVNRPADAIPSIKLDRPVTWTYKITRDGDPLGVMTVHFAPADQGRTEVTANIDIVAKAGPFVVYRFSHHATEQWDGDRLASLNAETDDNGSDQHIDLSSGPNGLIGTADNTPIHLPANAAIFDEWDASILRETRFFSVIDHRYLSLAFTKGTPGPAPGLGIEATPWKVTGDLDRTVWIDDHDRPVLVTFKSHGSDIAYVAE